MIELIKKINMTGTTIILSSHILEDISILCDKVLVINNKRIVAFDSPENLEMGYSNNKVIKLESELKDYTHVIKYLLNNGLITSYRMNNDCLLLFTNDTKTALKQIHGYYSRSEDNLMNMTLIKPSLDLVFESIYKGARQ